MTLLFCFFSFLYIYFFQGGGWNQNAQFDTVRAIVERGTMQITAFAKNTGDIGIFKNRIYSNKPPGLAFAAAPLYFILYHLERAFGISPDAFWTVNINAHLLTFFTSALPAVVLLLVLYAHFRRQQATSHEALCLTIAFGVGSLLLPYSGVMMNHLLTACLLFAAWHIISAAAPTPARSADLIAGILAGAAMVTESMAMPAAALFMFYVMRKRRAFAFMAGLGFMISILMLHNYLCFGNILINNQTIQPDWLKTRPDHFLGKLWWPSPIRVYWLTIHPFRGLFYCCPLLLLAILSFRWPRTLRAETGVPLAVLAYYFLFNICFDDWNAGWGIGPRYLIPATPFLYSFALEGFRRFPAAARLLMIVSASMMLCATAVWVLVPAPPGDGPPPALDDPVLYSFRDLAAGKVSVSEQGMLDYMPTPSAVVEWDSYNVGELFGLRRQWSLLPVILVLIGVMFTASMQHHRAIYRRLAGHPPRRFAGFLLTRFTDSSKLGSSLQGSA